MWEILVILRLEAATEGILKYFANFTGKHLCLSHFLNKLAGLRQIFAQFTNTFFHRTPPVAASIRPSPFWSKMKNYWNIYNKIWEKVSNIRSSHPGVFLEKGVLKICNKFTEEHPYRSVISIKLLCNFIEITLWHECSPVNLLHIFTTFSPKNTSGGLLLKITEADNLPLM